MDQSELLFQVVNELYKHHEEDYYCNVGFLLTELGEDFGQYDAILYDLHEKQYVTQWKDDREQFKISEEGIKYLQIEKSKRGQITQKEKLDLILKQLYKKYKQGEDRYFDVKGLMVESKIYTNDTEVKNLVGRLIDDKLVEAENGGRTYGFAAWSLVKISTFGIDYCEENSYAKPGVSLISNNYYISGTGSNIIQHSNRFTINQQFGETNKILELIEELKKKANEEEMLDSLREDIKECADEIAAKVTAQQKVPKFLLSSLISSAANNATIGGFAIPIGQLLGFIPIPK